QYTRRLAAFTPRASQPSASAAPADGRRAIRSERLSKRQIDAATASERIVAVFERLHTMEDEPRRTTPHDDVAALEPDSAWAVTPDRAAGAGYRGEPDGDRPVRRAEA